MKSVERNRDQTLIQQAVKDLGKVTYVSVQDRGNSGQQAAIVASSSEATKDSQKPEQCMVIAEKKVNSIVGPSMKDTAPDVDSLPYTPERVKKEMKRVAALDKASRITEFKKVFWVLLSEWSSRMMRILDAQLLLKLSAATFANEFGNKCNYSGKLPSSNYPWKPIIYALYQDDEYIEGWPRSTTKDKDNTPLNTKKKGINGLSAPDALELFRSVITGEMQIYKRTSVRVNDEVGMYRIMLPFVLPGCSSFL